MKRIFACLLLLSVSVATWAEGEHEKVVSRVSDAGTVLNEIMTAPDKGIPEDVLGSAECVAVVPSMLKGGFILGGAYGKGVASCRAATGWSAPAFFRVEGGSVGFQIGGQAVDLIMLIMNERGMRALLSSKFKLGADASVAAGPVGRHAEGATDWKMRAQVLTYSRARGIFAGVSLNGAVIKQDADDTRSFYGRMVPYEDLLKGAMTAPSNAQPFLSALNKYAPISPENKSASIKPSASPSTEPKAPATKPTETKANEGNSTDTRPSETKPAEAQSPETKAAVSDSTEPGSAAPKSPDAKPAAEPAVPKQ